MSSSRAWNTGSLRAVVDDVLYAYGLSPEALKQKTSSRNNPFRALLGSSGEITEKIHARIHTNLESSREAKKCRGQNTWNLRVTRTIPEKEERGLEFAYVKAGENHRWNQIPTASGLTDVEESFRTIDIVERLAPQSYRFIELKVGSDTPAYAAVELMLYSVLYVQCRRYWSFAFGTRDLMNANAIELSVMAPEPFFDTRHSRETLADAKLFVADGLNHLRQKLLIDNPLFAFSWLLIDPGTLETREL